MSAGPELQTGRLLLRRWRSSDLEPCALMNADPVVMEHFPSTLTTAQTGALIERIEVCFAENGFGLWALEQSAESRFVGFVGLMPVEPGLAFAPAVEIGWRLARRFWGQGLAMEAAMAAMGFGFEQLDLPTIVAYTATRNLRSRRLMAGLGMLRDRAEDFMHPGLALGDSLAPHVLYRMDRDIWRSSAVGSRTSTDS